MPPGDETVFRGLKSHPDTKDKLAVTRIYEIWKELGNAAHPTRWLAQQSIGQNQEGELFFPIGGRYKADWATQAFDRGTFATAILLQELDEHRPQTEEWKAELTGLIVLRNSNY
jgi:hypothetical protein